MNKKLTVLPDGFLDVDAFKFCNICGNPVDRSNTHSTVGLCKEHSEMMTEDCRNGVKPGRLKQIVEQRKIEYEKARP